MESKEYFEQAYIAHCEEMKAQLSDADLIYIDSCSLMDPFMPLFAEHIIPILEEQKKKLIVIENVLAELKRIMRPSYDPKKLSREIGAYVGLYTLSRFMENDSRRGFGILEYQSVPDELKAGHADAAFETILGMKSILNRVIIITQDKSLTEAVQKLSESNATARKKIRVFKIAHTGDMQGFLMEIKKQKPVPPIRTRKAEQPQKKQPSEAQDNTKKKPVKQTVDTAAKAAEAKPAVREAQPQKKPVTPATVERAAAKTPVIPSSDQLRSQDAVKYLKDTELHVPAGYRAISRVQLPEITAAYIPNSVTVIMPQAFIDCKSLTRVALPDSLESIEESAFQRCVSLHSVTIPHSVRRIDSAAFKDCSSLSSIILGHGLRELGSSVFANCTSLSEITIPAGVERIETMAFKGCRSLCSITLNEGLKAIGASAFSNCISLVSIRIPRSVTEIAATAFAACPSLILYCCEGSYAESFAKEHGMQYRTVL